MTVPRSQDDVWHSNEGQQMFAERKSLGVTARSEEKVPHEHGPADYIAMSNPSPSMVHRSPDVLIH